MNKAADKDGVAEVDAKIAALDDWRGAMLARVRGLIKSADPDIVEDVKWRKPSNPAGVPTWSHNGMVCTGEIYRDKVKLTFARGGRARRSVTPVQRQSRRRDEARDRPPGGRRHQ